jgi:hypothetical protein
MLKSIKFKRKKMNFNAENRNMNNNFLDMGRIQMNMNQLLLNNTCSFCGDTGHNIRTCNDSRIINFELECVDAKTLCSMFVEPINCFKLWLIDYYLDGNNGTLVKAFAIRRCRCRISTNIDIMIDRIISYFYENQENDENDYFIPFPQIFESIFAESDTLDEEPTRKFNIGINKIIDQNENEDESQDHCECAICYEDAIPQTNSVTLNCNHKFCKDCFKGCLKNTPSHKHVPSCALCRADVNTIIVYSESVKDEFDDYLSVL